jgi:hypothetical protein
VGPALIAWLMLRPYVRDRGPGATIELTGTAVAIALGVTSITFFLWRFIGLQPTSYMAFDIGVQALVAGAMLYRRGRPAGRTTRAGADTIEPRRLRTLGGGIAAAALGLGAMLLAHTLTELPHGWWDGWAIWNLRAAFLLVPDDHWRDGFTSALAWSHPDYPLLVPASVARLWSAGERVSAFAPQLFAIAVVTSSSLVLAGSVARHAGIIAMSLALSLLLVPSYVYWGASQTADVPLGLYILVAVAALAAPPAERRYVTAGLAAGFAAWAKNEGVLAAAAIVAVAAVLALRSPGGVRLLARFGIGLAVGVIALVLFKSALAPPSDLIRQIVTQQPLEKAADAARHIFVAGYIGRESFAWGNWFVMPPSVLLLACLAIAGVRWRDVPGQVVIGGVIVAVMLGGYYWIYVLSPYDLQWHLNTSWPRLVAQVWPTIVWTVVVAATQPAERGAKRSPRHWSWRRGTFSGRTIE